MEENILRQKTSIRYNLIRAFTDMTLLPLLTLQLSYRFNNKSKHTSCKEGLFSFPCGLPEYSDQIDVSTIISSDSIIRTDSYQSFTTSLSNTRNPKLMEIISFFNQLSIEEVKFTSLIAIVIAIKLIGEFSLDHILM